MPKNRNAEGVGEWLRRLLRDSFRVAKRYGLKTESPGLLQPWAETRQRFQRYFEFANAFVIPSIAKSLGVSRLLTRSLSRASGRPKKAG